jgi:hypothetical protein
VRLGDLLADCMEQLSHGGRAHGLRLQADVPPDLPPVELDKDLLRIALNNLLTNAAKYNREKGEVILSAEESDERIVISVQDTVSASPPPTSNGSSTSSTAPPTRKPCPAAATASACTWRARSSRCTRARSASPASPARAPASP